MELLAIYDAVRYFRHVLEARHFAIFTDHKLLTFTFHQKRDRCSPCQFNHLDFISQFTMDVRHISSQDNIIADALSWVEVITTPVTHDALAAAQDDVVELRVLLGSDTLLQFDKLLIPGTSVDLYCDTSACKP
jgi:cleavage and polyadenylation specificity factor subunit 1